MKYVPGMGPIGAKLMIVGEAPSYAESEAGKPFVGPSGKELDKLLQDARIVRSNCWVTNVCKYEVPPIGEKKIPFAIRCKQAGIDYEKQLEELQSEINAVAPNCILALGGTALTALYRTKISDYGVDDEGKPTKVLPIQKYRGSILQSSMGRKMVPTYHPAHLLHMEGGEVKGYWNRNVMILDFLRAYRQSAYADIRRPQRTLEICRNSAQLAEFIERYKNHTRPAIDIEAGGTCLPICVGVAFTPSHGITVPLWNQDGISNIPTSDLTSCWILLNRILNDYEIVGQNFKYDQDKLIRLGFRIKRLVSDTMLKAFNINPELPKRLGFLTSIYTEEPYYKDEGMYQGKLEDLFYGCARDACVTKEIDLVQDKEIDELGIRDWYENFTMPLHNLYLEIENIGFKVDYESRLRLLRKYVAWDEELRFKLWKATGEHINVNSPKQVKELLFDKMSLPARKGTGEEELTTLINNRKVLDKDKKVLEWILEDRRVRKAISTYLMAVPDYDGRMKTTYYLCLETGRTSTGQQDPPIRPELTDVVDEHGKKKKKALGIAFQTMTKHGDIGADIRECYVADDGEVFVNADSSQAEARVVALLSDDETTLRMYDEHDIHALTASWFFGGTEDSYSKKKLGYEHPIRFAGKTLRHAGHLGASPRRASIELNTQARKYKIELNGEPFRISEAIAKRALDIFHAKSPKIKQVFQASVINCLQKSRRLYAPIPYGIDAKLGPPRIFFERWGDELFRQAFAYIPQRAVSDNTKAAALRIKARLPQIKIIMEAHDALLFSIPESKVAEWIEVIREEMERPISFSNCSIPRRDLVIPCDIEIGTNYANLSKYKVKAA